jgi:hypothetical protein
MPARNARLAPAENPLSSGAPGCAGADGKVEPDTEPEAEEAPVAKFAVVTTDEE